MRSHEIINCISIALMGGKRGRLGANTSFQLGYFQELLAQVCNISPKGKTYIEQRLASLMQENSATEPQEEA